MDLISAEAEAATISSNSNREIIFFIPVLLV